MCCSISAGELGRSCPTVFGCAAVRDGYEDVASLFTVDVMLEFGCLLCQRDLPHGWESRVSLRALNAGSGEPSGLSDPAVSSLGT